MIAILQNITRVLNVMVILLKWPVALVFAILLPGFFWALWKAMGQLVVLSLRLWPFWLGFVVFVFLVRRFWRQSAVLLWLWTFEHEVTHALFALATLHPVVDFRVGPDHGYVKYIGIDTWLIRIAPYFFPLYLLTALGILVHHGRAFSLVGQVILGVTLASTVLHMLHEFHPKQPDLDTTGRVFAWFFVPAANVATWGLFLFFFFRGYSGIYRWWNLSWQTARLFWKSFT